jgi:hypothetical protein
MIEICRRLNMVIETGHSVELYVFGYIDNIMVSGRIVCPETVTVADDRTMSTGSLSILL